MNKMGMLPANGHRIQGRSSEDFLDADEILSELDLQGTESFMDAGCGDGHIAIKALKYIPDGVVYALDYYAPSIDDMEKFKRENNVENLIPICSDISDKIDLDDDILDVILLVNVMHGFKATRKLPEAISELSRIVKSNGGKIAIMDYIKQDVKHGPPTGVRLTTDELEEAFSNEGLKVSYLNSACGETIPEGKSHFFIIFEK